MEKKKIFIDRKRFFLMTRELPDLPAKFPLDKGSFSFGDWVVEVQELQEKSRVTPTTWKDLWQGEAFVELSSKNKLFLEKPQANALYPGNSPLGKWWNKHQVPAFLRNIIPVLSNDNQCVHEFLTGKLLDSPEGAILRISFHFKG